LSEEHWETPPPEIKNQPGFVALRACEGLQRIADPAFRTYTDDELEGFRRFTCGETNPSPFTFDGKGVPDIAAFTFAGADPDGRFLEHLVTLDASKPSGKWLKAADDHIARVGADRVLDGLARWLGHVSDLSLDRVDWEYVGEARTAVDMLATARDTCERAPRERSRAQALRRLALRHFAKGGQCLGPLRSPQNTE